MIVHEFIRSRRDSWARLQAFLEQVRRLTLARVPLEAFREGSSLYREAVADLAYARMQFPDHPVAKELGRLVGLAHSILYQSGRPRSSNWMDFWRRDWPASVRAASGPILLATAVFWAAAVVGFVLTAQNPALERFFISESMRDAIAAKRLWTESLAKTAPNSGANIAVNNISVSLLAWALGVSFGVGTAWLVVFNGVMLGAIAAACLRAGMLGPLAEFVVGHGSLELPAIWISAGAGLLMADAMLFPGRYGRRDELRLRGRASVKIMVGVVPLLLVAGAIEAFISPSDAPGAYKALLGLGLGLSLLAYIMIGGASQRGEDAVDEFSSPRLEGRGPGAA
ncbi:stage II sporulation protein M [Planctomyces sp. SH-PL62]|uniref:stage II sporulation protein M n=1 Tax=Planctomyces sp. SH-PL62 TaxID=1636152 RepID=UPI00078C9626|nr:stage II sporulation protein M [Planctomyces sp. SH-PL62]AMV38231.1 hypothetical protein VT85_12390 [Planctomyces sp. SH-PL62]